MAYIYENPNTHQLIDDLIRDEFARWTHAQSREIVEYFESLAEDSDQPILWDPVAIRCRFSAYDSALDFAKSYGVPREIVTTEEDALYFAHSNGATLLQCDDGSVVVEDF